MLIAPRNRGFEKLGFYCTGSLLTGVGMSFTDQGGKDILRSCVIACGLTPCVEILAPQVPDGNKTHVPDCQ